MDDRWVVEKCREHQENVTNVRKDEMDEMDEIQFAQASKHRRRSSPGAVPVALRGRRRQPRHAADLPPRGRANRAVPCNFDSRSHGGDVWCVPGCARCDVSFQVEVPAVFFHLPGDLRKPQEVC